MQHTILPQLLSTSPIELTLRALICIFVKTHSMKVMAGHGTLSACVCIYWRQECQSVIPCFFHACSGQNIRSSAPTTCFRKRKLLCNTCLALLIAPSWLCWLLTIQCCDSATSSRQWRIWCKVSGHTRHADTGELADAVEAGGIVLAGHGQALVDVNLAARAGITTATLALEWSFCIHTLSKVLAWVGTCKYSLIFYFHTIYDKMRSHFSGWQTSLLVS